MRFKTINDMTVDIYNSIKRIPNEVDLIVGVPRSGMLAASIISLYLNLPLTDVEAFESGRILKPGNTKHRDHWIRKVEEARVVLVVDDSVLTGKSIEEIKNRLSKLDSVYNMVYYAVYVTHESAKCVDLFCSICDYPRMFEWNCLHHPQLNKVCIDMDGILCEYAPVDRYNDEKYREDILSTAALIVPTFTIGLIITSRHEKYRKETEIWLKKNGIKYSRLLMNNHAKNDDKNLVENVGFYMGIEYKKYNEIALFIENDDYHAREISRISGKGVFCLGSHMYYDENIINKTKNTIRYGMTHRILSKIKKVIIKDSVS
jgi:uncharacterized HAD superfamily protein/hypoxanthine phosphoribosyltransferase